MQIIPGIFSRRLIRKYIIGILSLFSLVTVVNKADCQTTEFFTPGTFNYTVPSYSGPFEAGDVIEKVELTVTIVGGGGGGGRGQGAGGGGGGQVRVLSIEVNSGDVFPVVVGAGGAGKDSTDGAGFVGTASSFNGQSAAGGLGGGGGNAGNGGSSGGGNLGGTAGPATGGGNSALRAGGGGGGTGTMGINGDATGPGTKGGNGGSGISSYGGGGGGAARRQGANAASNNGDVQGIGLDGGTDGSTGNAVNAVNGGGGGGGWTRGGNGGNGLVIVNIKFSILPVELLYAKLTFDGKSQSTKINWSTAKEWESSHFEIQRSSGSASDFKKIGEVAAMGWKDSVTEYEFVDKELPLFGGLLLYRIKQVDLNERYAYSDLMSIRTPEVATTKGVWRAYPNPTNGDQLRIGLLDRSQYEAEQIHFRLIHPTVQSPVTTVASEAEMNEALATMISQIPKGVFVVEIQWGQKVEHIKVLKP